jgi:hypothetical protein
MLSRALSRLLFAAAFLLSTQAALQHPLQHLGNAQGAARKAATLGEEHRYDRSHAQQCDVCVALAALGAAAPLLKSFVVASAPRSFSESARASRFVAAFTPQFRSQAPPALL